LPNCPKCGARVREDYDFCPKCGTALKPAPQPVPTAPPAPTTAAPPPAPPSREEKYEKREKEERGEKREKEEKGEKREKYEKYEKYERREVSFLGPLIGGLILIFVGLMFYVATQLAVPSQLWVALFFIIIGIIVVIAGVYAVMTATRRSPSP